MGSKPSKVNIDDSLNIFNSVVNTACVNTVNSCASASIVEQELVIHCLYQNGRIIYEENSVCLSCLNRVLEQQLQAIELERIQNKLKSVTVNMESLYNSLTNQIELCGVNSCKACVFKDIIQANLIENSNLCESSTNLNETFQTNLQDTLTATLNNNAAFLKGAQSALGGGTSEEIASKFTSQISTVSTYNFFNDALNTLRNNQNINIDSSGSVSVTAITQEMLSNTFLTMLSDNNIILNSISQSVLDEIDTVINDQTSLTEDGAKIIGGVTTLIGGFEKSMYYTMICTLILLLAVLLLTVFYAIYTIIQRKLSNSS